MCTKEKLGIGIWAASAVLVIALLVAVIGGIATGGQTAGDAAIGIVFGGFALGAACIFLP
jgi:hypothetical protein